MIVPDNKNEILRHLQGKWMRKAQDGTTVSFVIEGMKIRDIEIGAQEIKEMDFILEFNNDNLKWQLTSSIFGRGSALINFEKDSFTILIRNGADIIPPVNITEVVHQSVMFHRHLK